MSEDQEELLAALIAGLKSGGDDIAHKLSSIVERKGDGSENKLTPVEIGDVLMRRFAMLEHPHEFAKGQLVRWKPGLRNRRYPLYGNPAIVLEIFKKPVGMSSDDPSSPYYREPVDIQLGLIDSDQDFLTFFFDKRRFEPFDV